MLKSLWLPPPAACQHSFSSTSTGRNPICCLVQVVQAALPSLSHASTICSAPCPATHPGVILLFFVIYIIYGHFSCSYILLAPGHTFQEEPSITTPQPASLRSGQANRRYETERTRSGWWGRAAGGEHTSSGGPGAVDSVDM